MSCPHCQTRAWGAPLYPPGFAPAQQQHMPPAHYAAVPSVQPTPYHVPLYTPYEAAQQQQQQQTIPVAPSAIEAVGRVLWPGLHTLAAYYPEVPTSAQRQASRDMYHALGALLPCPHCAADYTKLFQRRFRNASRDELFQSLVDMHNDVNARLGKPLVTYAQARAMYYPRTAQ